MLGRHENSYSTGFNQSENKDKEFIKTEAEILLNLTNQDTKKVPDLILADNGFVGEVLRNSLEIGYTSAEILNFMPSVMKAHKQGIKREDIESQLKKIKKEKLPITAIISNLEKQIK